MLLLPRVLSFSISAPPSRILRIFPSRSTLVSPFSRPAASLAARSHVAVSIPNPQPTIGDEELEFDLPFSPSIPDEAPIQIPLEKLFVPPDVDLAGSLATATGRVLKGSNIVLGPYAAAGGARISAAEFVKSSTRKEDCPADGLPEFALVGRSNVGKSSLLNSLVRRKRLALTSKKPGI